MCDKFGLRPSQGTQRHIAAAKTFADAEKLIERKRGEPRLRKCSDREPQWSNYTQELLSQ